MRWHEAGDALNATNWMTNFWREDAELKFAEYPLVKGRTALIEFFDGQFALLDLMKHTIKTVDIIGDKVYQEATITYMVKGDPEQKKIDLQGIAVYGRKPGDEKINFLTVYLDPTELNERMALVFGSQA